MLPSDGVLLYIDQVADGSIDFLVETIADDAPCGASGARGQDLNDETDSPLSSLPSLPQSSELAWARPAAKMDKRARLGLLAQLEPVRNL